MIKKIITALFLILLGYLVSVWFPMPADWQNQLHQLTQLPQKTSDVDALFESASSLSNPTQAGPNLASGSNTPSSTPNLPNDANTASSNATEHAGSDPSATEKANLSNAFTATDLLFSSTGISEKVTLSLGTFPDQASADNALKKLEISEALNFFPYKKPTGQAAVLVTLGEFTDQGEALKAKTRLEDQFGINLSVVKKPENKENK